MQFFIIGGFPRAGTRQFADILSKTTGFEVKGEFYPAIIRSLTQTFTLADTVHHPRWTNQNYRTWRMRTALNAYAGLSKGSNSHYNFEKNTIIGIKCPRAEIQFEDLRTLIGFDSVTYFYCARGIRENYLSENSTFSVKVDDYATRTISSMEAGIAISKRKDVKFRVLHLDDYLFTQDKSRWLKEKVFSCFQSISLTNTEIEEIVARTVNSNATEKQGKIRRQALSNDERDYLLNHVQFISVVNRFEKEFKINLQASAL